MFRDEFAVATRPRASARPLPWIEVAPGAPYFVTDAGEPWTPIGQNDAISWVELKGLFRRRDLPGVIAHLDRLADHGVTVLRLMLEYAQGRHRYIERPVGRFVPAMVELWDDLFRLCEERGIRILLTPFDTFWTWLHWRHHPYNRRNGGPLGTPARMLLCPEARAAIKARLSFVVERWGGSGALFAYDLWNEIHPAQAEDTADCFGEFIHDLSSHVRSLEHRLYGRSHPHTVSIFGPELWWRPHLPLKEPIYRHPDLDVATIHIYRQGTIDDPRDTVAPALDMGRIVAEALAEISDGRPFFDSEHGPIHSYKDRHRTLPEPFDDEYFRHMQWAHLAAGGAGGGMRWPNRTPHVLTRGMREAQRALAAFQPLLDWPRFRRRNLNEEVAIAGAGVEACACGDDRQALVWLVRTDSLQGDGRIAPCTEPTPVEVRIPGLAAGVYRLTTFDTARGVVLCRSEVSCDGGPLAFEARVSADLAFAITPA
jgi:hypothetical protein